MLEGNSYQAIERTGQMEALNKMIKNADRLMFDGAAEAIQYLRNKNKYEKS